MVIDQLFEGIIAILLSCFTNAASIALNASEPPYVLYMQLQHQGNSLEMIAIKHIFYANQIYGIISRLFFIHFVAPYFSSSIWLKYYFKSFCMKI